MEIVLTFCVKFGATVECSFIIVLKIRVFGSEILVDRKFNKLIVLSFSYSIILFAL